MRIIAGRYKGRRLVGLARGRSGLGKGPGVRPTSDKLRETLFNVVAARVEGARVLDAFAGTGALGLEALSRGAASVVFIEHDRRALDLIEQNLRLCGIEGGYAIMRGAFEQVVDRLARDARFDLILLDPPYDHADYEQTIAAVAARLADDGLVALEHARRRPAPERAGPLTKVREVVSGDSALAMYRHV